ncbi:LacI family DNA-binding transcriptional regulator [Lentzea sp. CC55]|uniref:LacI family DNA-binding transcriptional regulator n=1 Tax=Lentzea sp. CC55 TaxID=2884909 RepID=UPI0027E0A459|nr:LacI family DNA-binding transcriptional regulator [Lentzea sp. CC55]MCG8922565.1 LacI family transcriptional regulator [Lentzea sp. CC55]
MERKIENVKQRASLRDIAAETGVSIATVSRVLNDHVNVAQRTRDLVLRAVERRAVASQRTRTVYVRCPYVLTDYFGLLVSSVAEGVKLHGLRLVLDAGESGQGSSVLRSLPETGDVDAAILILPPEDGEELLALSRAGFPFVVLDPRVPPLPDIASVSAAHFAGARAVADHLISLGHRDIAVIAGPEEWLAGDARLAGHRAALAQAGVLLRADRLRHVEPTTAHGRRAAAELLQGSPRPSAVVCFNDKVAVGTLQAARELGLRVPADLSVAGFDDIDLAEATSPPLTTVRQPLEEMGRIAVAQLIRMVEGQALEALHIELATGLVVRGSTAAVA